MKRILCLMGVLCTLSFLSVACDDVLEIPRSEIKSLDKDAMCTITGGVFKHSLLISVEDDKDAFRCFCGGTDADHECNENVTCQYNDLLDQYKCGGFGITLLPSGPCMMDNVIVCGERIDSQGRALGYETKCENNQWTEERYCGGVSCKIYEFKPGINSSQCGDCQNADNGCKAGEMNSSKE